VDFSTGEKKVKKKREKQEILYYGKTTQKGFRVPIKIKDVKTGRSHIRRGLEGDDQGDPRVSSFKKEKTRYWNRKKRNPNH